MCQKIVGLTFWYWWKQLSLTRSFACNFLLTVKRRIKSQEDAYVCFRGTPVFCNWIQYFSTFTAYGNTLTPTWTVSSISLSKLNTAYVSTITAFAVHYRQIYIWDINVEKPTSDRLELNTTESPKDVYGLPELQSDALADLWSSL